MNRWGQQLKRVCPDCGEEFIALNLGNSTRRYCDKCSVGRIADEEEQNSIKVAMAEEAIYQRRIVFARIPPLWQGSNFGNSDSTLYPKTFKRIEAYAERFTAGAPSLVLYSLERGRGKTHMAACIANYALHQLRCQVLFMKARDLMIDIRRTFSDQGDTEAGILDRVSSTKLLVLDDVGVDPPTEWIKSTYWTVFDRRLEWQLPIVVTTNRQIDGDLAEYIGEGAVSRLVGLSRGNVIDMSGDDLR